jgi:hypothetical protein
MDLNNAAVIANANATTSQTVKNFMAQNGGNDNAQFLDGNGQHPPAQLPPVQLPLVQLPPVQLPPLQPL